MNFKFALSHSARLLAFVVFVYFSATAMYGVYSNYHAVPVWDMWNGYLEFYFRSRDEGWPVWWEQHNEHRIALAKLFYWVDVHFFQGNLIILFALNFVFSFLAFITFSLVLRGVIGPQRIVPLCFGVSLFAALCFSWLQNENYTWAFQSQFHMAYLLPLWAFLALAKSHQAQSRLWFVAALTLGVLSIATMANGVLALPLMLVLSLVLGLNKKQVASLIGVTCIALYMYFHDYQEITWHPSMKDGLLNTPKQSLIYFSKYISGPLSPYVHHHLKLALLVGMLFVLTSMYFAWTLIRPGARKEPQHATLSALLTFVVFIGGTATSTALGRAVIGMDVPSRYMTPALLGWCALLLLLIQGCKTSVMRHLLLGLAAVPIFYLLIPVQAHALRFVDGPHKFRTAAVALAWQVKDLEALKITYWSYDRLTQIDALARAEGKSIYSQPYVQQMPTLHSPLVPASAGQCKIYFDTVAGLPDDLNFNRVEGWAYAPGSTEQPMALVIGADDKAAGYAVIGLKRQDVADAFKDVRAEYSGFTGYVLVDSLQSDAFVVRLIDRAGRVLCSSEVERLDH